MRIEPRHLEPSFQFNKVEHHKSWETGKEDDIRMHKIHVYPAKFPSFIIGKALDYAKKNEITINAVGDIFCGCGTTALEAKRNGKTFWGCDINPVATLIAKVKSDRYDEFVLLYYYDEIVKKYKESNLKAPRTLTRHERITYWFHLGQIKKLYRLLMVIARVVPEGKYRDFFLVAFSNILKGTSKWLTESIKPQVDPTKPIANVRLLFDTQVKLMIRAAAEINTERTLPARRTIVNRNFLRIRKRTPFLDMLITSPPYVTSYEYADIHQLSTLWLGYTKDYRTLRVGTIGSVYHHRPGEMNISGINEIGKTIYNELLKKKRSRTKGVAQYFIDMNKVVLKSYSMINYGGLAIFVIGNTKYKGVYVDNAKYLAKCMTDAGFADLEVIKRRISSKILSPYRNKDGKFSNDKRKRKVYSYEFVIIARKNNERR